MECPYCGREMGTLPVHVIRATMTGYSMLGIFDAISQAGDRGISLSRLAETLYPDRKHINAYNAIKVTMLRLRERLRRYGWTVESGTSQQNSTERVYRFKRSISLQPVLPPPQSQTPS